MTYDTTRQADNFRGVVATVLTPFTNGGEIDHQSLKQLLDFYADNGVKGILVPVVASEVDKLSDEERLELTASAIDAVSGRYPVIGGLVSETPEEVKRASESMLGLGCAGLVCRAPRSIGTSNDRRLQLEYFQAAAEECPYFVVQDLAFDDFGMPLDFIELLVSSLPQFRAIKVEVVRTGYKATRILELTGGAVDVWSGWAALQMIEGLDRGIKVFNVSAYNRLFIKISEIYVSGNREEAINVFETLLPYLAFGRQHIDINLQLTKRYLVERGVFSTARMRQPCVEYDRFHERFGDEIIKRMIEWESTDDGI